MSDFGVRREIPYSLAAIFIAFVLWLIAVQADREISWYPAPIKLENVPANMQIQVVMDRPGATPSVQVNVQFPRDLLGRISENNFSAVIDAADIFNKDLSQWQPPTEPRTRTYGLTLANVRIYSLPRDVDVIGIDPSQIKLEATLRTRMVHVEVPVAGELPASLELTGSLIPQPESVYVTGAQDVLEKLSEEGDLLRTAPVDLSTLTRSGQIYRDLQLPEGVLLVNPVNQRIEVNVGLQERNVSRTLNGVPISIIQVSGELRMKIDPPTADITLEGPPSVLEQISADDFTFSTLKPLEEKPGPAQTIGLEASFRARVDPELARKVRILEINPSRIAVEFIPVTEENGESLLPSAP